jgi:poly-gamma-glutamate synthesis protein (capsule biosynthesis protein)
LSSLSKLGFNTVSLASRHSYDKGMTGITNTIKTTLDNKFVYAGINDTEDNRLKNNIIEKNGLKIALLSYTTSTDITIQSPNSVDLYSEDLVKSDVENIKDKVDVIMVSIDWSNIISDVVTEEQKRIANYLESLGVDIVVGNTGYTIQPIEKINDTLVCYSLGNLLSGHYAVDSRISAMVHFNLKVTKSLTEKMVSFEDINVLLTFAYNYNNTMYKVIPFTKLTNELLDHKAYYNKYNELLTNSNLDIKLYSIGE